AGASKASKVSRLGSTCWRRSLGGAKPWTGHAPGIYRATMTDVAVSLDDVAYRRARMVAAERDASVSALVKRFLVELTSGESEFERLKRLEEETRAKITNFSASENLPRDELYDRRF